MSSFFTLPSSQRKRKRAEAGGPTSFKRKDNNKRHRPTQVASRPQRDDSISGSGSEDEEDDGRRRAETPEDEDDKASSDDEGETAAEKRLRLAERYLDNIRDEIDETGFDAEQIDRDLIAERLKDDLAESKGRLYRRIASSLAFEGASQVLFRADTQATTSVAACPPSVYTVSKDLTLVKWEIQPAPTRTAASNGRPPRAGGPSPGEMRAGHRRRPKQKAFVRGRRKAGSSDYIGHIDHILTVAASEDGRFVVTGGRDRRIVVWNAADLKPLRMFTQHRDAVTGLAFRRGTNQLYSASKDRTIKLWSLDELAYVETLFGHQDDVVDIAALAQERCISVGARDRTARLWKVADETQLVFRGGGGAFRERKRGGRDKAAEVKGHGPSVSHAEGSMDRIALIDEEAFVTGSDNGSICLWNLHKKKPVFTIPVAHGLDPAPLATDSWAEADPAREAPCGPRPRWITALATVPHSDLVLSGSWDGYVRVWRVAADKRSLEPLGSLGGSSAAARAITVNGHHQSVSTSEIASLGLGHTDNGEANEQASNDGGENTTSHTISPAEPATQGIRGIVNDLTVIDRHEHSRTSIHTNANSANRSDNQPNSKTEGGVCVIAAIGNEHRLGRWKMVQDKKVKNGAVLFEVPFKTSLAPSSSSAVAIAAATVAVSPAREAESSSHTRSSGMVMEVEEE